MTLIHVLAHGAGRAAEEEGVAGLRALAAVILARRSDTTVDVAVRRGDPARELARLLEERRPDLLVVGRGPAQGPLGMLRPTIIERVASRSEVPVLSVGSDHLSAYRRSLVAIESPAEVSSRPVEIARRLLGAEACAVHVVHPLDPAIQRRMERAGAPRHAILLARSWLRSRTREQIRSWLEESMPASDRISLRTGDPGAAILDIAGRTMPDLLVVAADRRWLRGGFLRRSVAGVVLTSVGCDVLIVRSCRAASTVERPTTAAA